MKSADPKIDNPFGADVVPRVNDTVAVLEAIEADRGLLALLDPDVRRRLLMAAGRVSRPSRNAMRAQARAMRRMAKQRVRQADEEVLAQTGIRTTRRKSVFPTPRPELSSAHSGSESGTELGAAQQPDARPFEDRNAGPSEPPSTSPRRVRVARNCYQCKRDFHQLHSFYDAFCPECAEFNWAKRNQTTDLSGRIALLTGGRVKIGYQIGIKLLRAGARVVVTTRFPRDAAARYAAEPDFGDWADRIEIHGLDLRHTPSVEQFARTMYDRLDWLDFLINNACQTVRRPRGFYRHLMAAESRPDSALAPEVRALLPRARPLSARGGPEGPGHLTMADPIPVGMGHSAQLSQIPLLPHDLESGDAVFPAGQLDSDLQQIDLRPKNSWRLTLSEVGTVELLEVHLVNAVAPFVLCARLKPLMMRQASRDKHIVNVSAVEGQFYRRFKTDKHPHTNMAKAALNMMTRTSAADYVEYGIHMNSVDTGWITDEDAAEIAARKQREHRFHPPLDSVDGAARVCDPIFDGYLTGIHQWGKFFKDYRETRW